MPLAVRHSLAVAVLAAAAGTVAAPVWAQDPPAAEKPAAPPAAAVGPAIDLVLCLDISGSMNGLVDSAKLRLWDIVNELARLKPTPNLRVALYSYGGTTASYPAATGWVRKDVDLTEDLDDVYKALNGLTITGGTELVARVSKAALDQQKWSDDKNALRMIFVAGNEAADQDKAVALADVAAQAKKLGVVVNTIYCGNSTSGDAPGWARFAADAGGKYMNIDQNKAVKQVAVKTEFDDQIVKLGEELNKTYVAYGKDGKAGAANQAKQDANAAAAPGAPGAGVAAAVSRAESKATALYKNSAWDLVDKMKDKDFDLAKIKEEDLCDEMKKLNPEDRLAFLKKKADERADLQKKITDLSAQRQKKIDAELAKGPRSDADKALDEALKGLIRDQAKDKGFEVPGETK